MDFLLSADGSLLGLFLASFLAATLLPGGSEIALFAVVRLHPEQAAIALALATVGNTLGGMSTYLLARLLPQQALPARLGIVKRYGVAALFFAWAPVIGDALCAVAGVAPQLAGQHAMDGARKIQPLSAGGGRRRIAVAAAARTFRRAADQLLARHEYPEQDVQKQPGAADKKQQGEQQAP